MFKQPSEIDLDKDLVEFVGTDKSTKADDKRKAAPRVAVPATGSVDPISGFAAAPVGASREAPTPVAVYVPPATGQSQPKVSRKGAADRLDAAEANLSACQLEVSAARDALRTAEHLEAESHQCLIQLLPAPSAADVHRAMLESERDAKLQRVAEGQPAVAPKVITVRSPIDLAAASRPRTSQQSPNAPLFSPVQRNVV